jgi:hypothetical protein
MKHAGPNASCPGYSVGGYLLTGIYAFVWCHVGMAEVKAFMTAALTALPSILLRIWLPEEMGAYHCRSF